MSRFLSLLEGVLAFVLAAIAALVMYQVASRYVLGSPPSWTEELARYLQVWLVLLAAPVCLARGMHLSMDYLTPKLPPMPRRLVKRTVLVLVAAFSGLWTVFGIRLLSVAALQTSPALGLSMVWPYLAMPISGALSLAVTLWLWVGRTSDERGTAR